MKNFVDFFRLTYTVVAVSLQKIVEHVLYDILHVHGFSKQTRNEIKSISLSKNSTYQSSSTAKSGYTLKQFYSELEADIDKNQRPKVELIEYQFDHKINRISI